MIKQITGQTAQQAPALPITNQETTQQAAVTIEPQAKVETKEAEKGLKKPLIDKPDEKAEKGKDSASSRRY